MSCPFESPHCLCQYCNLDECLTSETENERCNDCLEKEHAVWTKVLCPRFNPKANYKDMQKENLRILQS